MIVFFEFLQRILQVRIKLPTVSAEILILPVTAFSNQRLPLLWRKLREKNIAYHIHRFAHYTLDILFCHCHIFLILVLNHLRP